VGGPGNEADLLLISAADRAEPIANSLTELRRQAPEAGVEIIYEEQANKLDAIGHEHFGFQDGVSQPGVRGRLSKDPASYITPRLLAPDDIPDSWLYGLPGQYLVWPGEFIFGYPKSGADPLIAGSINQPGPAWSHNGSYVVFRRLRQDVSAFWTFIYQHAEGLAKRPGFDHVTPDWLAARVVGRWKSGAPISRVPDEDHEELGINRLANNNFEFAASAPSPPLTSGGQSDPWPEAASDPIGLTCPMAAHIRKVNARETPTDFGGRRASFNRRILRRGLPFGQRLEHPFGEDPAAGNRGILFVSYQASIEDQFEFLNSVWMASPTNPRSPSGHDMLVGQNNLLHGGRGRQSVLFGENGEGASLTTTSDFVIPTGGGYFFSPSIKALEEVLAS
jgi:Dyp-type peroxidase family